ncbi:hypothetical protein KKA50_02260 [Patescibacteria group bacterium]|nr:hypothetical protein [Patescibacteria group bacterium]
MWEVEEIYRLFLIKIKTFRKIKKRRNKMRKVIGTIVLVALGICVGFMAFAMIWNNGVIPLTKHVIVPAWNVTKLVDKPVATNEEVQPASNTLSNESNGNDVTTTIVVTKPEIIPVSNGSSLDSFPGTTAYQVVMNFKDGSTLTKGFMTDLDLQDDKETWTRIQLVGISDLVVSNSAPLLFFYNGYVFPIAGGQDQSLGEIWETAMSNDIKYDAGFSIRQLANGCRELSSTWTDTNGVEQMQAQTAVNADLASWLEQYCDATEIAQWKADRATLGMPESLFTK